MIIGGPAAQSEANKEPITIDSIKPIQPINIISPIVILVTHTNL
jgi:hypothetical protein